MADIKKKIKKAWKFIWDDDSAWSWIANIVLAFLLIYFIVYPGLGAIFQTSHPIVAVVSGSMEHEGNFDDWWNSPASCAGGACTQSEWYMQKNISKSQFREFPFKNGFNKGDLMVLSGKPPENIGVGEVIVFLTRQKSHPIIHRVVDMGQEKGEYYFQTKGDHNSLSFGSDTRIPETSIPEENIIGYEKYKKASRAILRIPYLGWIKIWFVESPVIFFIAVVLIITISSNIDAIRKFIGV